MENNVSFLERLSQKIAPASKELNMNANKVGLAARNVDPYVSGISPEDAYKLQLAERAAQNNYERNLGTMQNAQVRDGVIDPKYWDAADKASQYEMRGLAGRGY